MFDRKFWALSAGEQHSAVLAASVDLHLIKTARDAYELSYRVARMLKHGGIDNLFDLKRLESIQYELRKRDLDAAMYGEQSLEENWWTRDKYISAKWAYQRLLKINKFFNKERYERLDRKITYTWDDIPF